MSDTITARVAISSTISTTTKALPYPIKITKLIAQLNSSQIVEFAIRDAHTEQMALSAGAHITVNDNDEIYVGIITGIDNVYEFKMDQIFYEEINIDAISGGGTPAIVLLFEFEPYLEFDSITMAQVRELLAEQSKIVLRQATKGLDMSYDITPGYTGRQVTSPGEVGFQVRRPGTDIIQVGVTREARP